MTNGKNYLYWPYTIILVYTIILISKTGNPTRLFHNHGYSRCESSKYNDVLEFATYYGDASLWANKMYFHGLTEDRQHHIPKWAHKDRIEVPKN